MKKFMEEFKAFALRGNVLDMAVGVVVGGAFNAIVTSLVSNIITPLIASLGGVNYEEMMWLVNGSEVKYGLFLNAIVNFLIHCLHPVCGHQGGQQAVQPAQEGRRGSRSRSARRAHREGLPLLLQHHLHQGHPLPPLHLRAGRVSVPVCFAAPPGFRAALFCSVGFVHLHKTALKQCPDYGKLVI